MCVEWILRYKAMVGALYKLIYYNNIIIYFEHNMSKGKYCI